PAPAPCFPELSTMVGHWTVTYAADYVDFGTPVTGPAGQLLLRLDAGTAYPLRATVGFDVVPDPADAPATLPVDLAKIPDGGAGPTPFPASVPAKLYDVNSIPLGFTNDGKTTASGPNPLFADIIFNSSS